MSTMPDEAILQSINALAKYVDTNNISDGYHTFGELYEHRIALYIALALAISVDYEHSMSGEVWRSRRHADGSEWDGWFILGIGTKKGKQITYHLPSSKWADCDFAKDIELAPAFDGHTSNDVLERIKKL